MTKRTHIEWPTAVVLVAAIGAMTAAYLWGPAEYHDELMLAASVLGSLLLAQGRRLLTRRSS